VLFGWPETDDRSRLDDYFRVLRDVMRLGVNVVAVSTDARRWGVVADQPSRDRRIDVWWKGDDASRLALLAAYLFTRTPEWRKSKIRLVTVVDVDADAEAANAQLEAMLEDVRIPATVTVLIGDNSSVAAENCATASLVLVPMRVRRSEVLDPMNADLHTTLQQLPLAAAVVAAAPVDLAAGPDSGAFSALTEAEERADSAIARLKRLETSLRRADSEVSEYRVKAELDPSEEVDQALEAAEIHLASVQRRTLKARAVAELAQREVAELVERGPRSV
jgi:hypothetical protein